MKEILYRSPNPTHRKDNLSVHSRISKFDKFGDKNLRSLGAHIWNSLPQNIK